MIKLLFWHGQSIDIFLNDHQVRAKIKSVQKLAAEVEKYRRQKVSEEHFLKILKAEELQSKFHSQPNPVNHTIRAS